ncbi:MAG: class I tRNA ligase family protein, partial [Ideonella sp.]
WNDAGVEGAHRFLRRVWSHSRWAFQYTPGALEAQSRYGNDWKPLESVCRNAWRDINLIFRQANFDYERMQYNTVISAAMKLLNVLEEFRHTFPGSVEDAGEAGKVATEGVRRLLQVLYPACPHITWILWRDLGFAAVHGDLLDAAWPEVDEAALQQDEIELMLQVNGKLRGSIKVAAGASKSVIEATALANADCLKFSEGKRPKKVIIVPGRLVNVVV